MTQNNIGAEDALPIDERPVSHDLDKELPVLEPVSEQDMPGHVFGTHADEDVSIEDTAALTKIATDQQQDDADVDADATAEIEKPAELYSNMQVSGLSKRGMRLRIILVVAVIGACLGFLYGFGVKRFQNRFLPNTSIYGCDVSSMTQEEAVEALDAETLTYVCDISSGDFSASVTGSDIEIERDEEAIAKEARIWSVGQ